MVSQGADIIDIGGESTRPGSTAIPEDEEISRVIPVLREVVRRCPVPVSIDTRKAAVARAALAEGAAIINDVSGLKFDPKMAETAAASRCPVVLMHMRGTPATMTSLASYRDVVGEVIRALTARIKDAIRAGVAKSQIIVDPGFGFAKRPAHNLALLRGLQRVAALGYPVLVGFSGKIFAGYDREAGEAEKIARNAAAEAIAVKKGAAIIRVHEPAHSKASIRLAALCVGRIKLA
jgi:dihydropteroate synthase